jgi:protein-S-isoprenylcysteine O-methyltransferase Ste14
MSNFGVLKWRIPMTRILGVLLMSVIVFSESAWDIKSKMIGSLLFLFGCSLAAIGSLGRLWCSLYVSGYKKDKLIMTGPYSMTRNPLYFFSLIGAIGVGLATETLTIPFIILIAYGIYIPFVIKSEEQALFRIHAKDFSDYMNSTPRFFPKFSLLVEPEEYNSHPVTFRKSISSAIWFIWFLGILEFIDGIQESGIITPWFKLY